MTVSAKSPPHEEALAVIQQAVFDLAQWLKLEINQPRPNDSEAIKQAKKYLYWSNEPGVLRSLFDLVDLSDIPRAKEKRYYWAPDVISDSKPKIPYPKQDKPKKEDLEALKPKIKKEIDFLTNSSEDWNNLSLLMLILEKFASFISFGEEDVALVDKARTTAAVAAALAAENMEDPKLCIVAGDLSGIQKFIYTISSDGALRSLRARSFYLELVTEEVVQQLLTQLDLPRTNIIYAGGGNVYILAPGTEDTEKTQEVVKKVRIKFNQWLKKEFQGKVYLALDSSNPFPAADIASEGKFAEHWSAATKKLAVYKSRKFSDRVEDISELLEPYSAHTPCQVCHRDDELNLHRLNPKETDSPMACSSCCKMFELGSILFYSKAILRSESLEAPATKKEEANNELWFRLPALDGLQAVNVCYRLFDSWKQINPGLNTTLLINDWELEHYKFRHFRNNAIPLLLGNFGKTTEELTEKPEEIGFMRAKEMANNTRGIKRLGYLRMDVDNLGQIFARGLNKKQTLPRLAGLSRQISYFFKVYLNSLAANRLDNIKNISGDIKALSYKDDIYENHKEKARVIQFIYAGGDDLFVGGAWNEVVDFGFDVYQCFRAYTGQHPDITISGGISINDIKFPLYQAASEAEEAEKAAKGNKKDSLGLFGEPFKWDEWLGTDDVKKLKDETQTYLEKEVSPKLLGIMPFVKALEKQQIGADYSRNFVRNLLITAQIQNQALEKLKEKELEESEEAKGTRYYLHLPKVAYTLARLPKEVLKDEDFRKSLKNPYNAPYFRAIATWIELLNRE